MLFGVCVPGREDLRFDVVVSVVNTTSVASRKRHTRPPAVACPLSPVNHTHVSANSYGMTVRRGPYLTTAAPTSITVRWRSSHVHTGSVRVWRADAGVTDHGAGDSGSDGDSDSDGDGDGDSDVDGDGAGAESSTTAITSKSRNSRHGDSDLSSDSTRMVASESNTSTETSRVWHSVRCAGVDHEVEVSGLQPDTLYMYQVRRHGPSCQCHSVRLVL
jgi:hypothetical protein